MSLAFRSKVVIKKSIVWDIMKTDVQAVVIGGGVIGCSILYHLAKAGWSNCVLVERNELTSGSTWHAAANIHGLHDTTNVSRIQHYTMNLYRQLEHETGQSCKYFNRARFILHKPSKENISLDYKKARQSFMIWSFLRFRKTKQLSCILF